MTSEIRANIIKNRVGLGTIEYSNTGPIISGVTTALNFKTGTSNLHNTGLNVQDLDVDGHTNLDNVSIAGVTTFASHAHFGNNVRAIFATNNRLQILSNGTNNYFDYAGSLNVRGSSGSAAALSFLSNSNVLVSNNLEISKDLDVDGHTNLDNVSIAGVSTFSGNLDANGVVYVRQNASPTIYLTSNSTTGSGRLFFGDPDSDLVGRLSYVHNGDYFTFYAGYGERFRIAGNGDITVTSIDNFATGPTLKLFHNSASPAADDVVSRISMFGDDSAGNETEYGRVETKIDDPANGQETAHIQFATRGYSSFNQIFRLKNRGTASAPSYTTDDINGIILDVYNTGNPYPRYMNFIAKAAGNTDSNIAFWTEAVGGSPTEKLRISSTGQIHLNGASSSTTGTSATDLLMANAAAIRFRKGDGSAWINTVGLDGSNNLKLGWGGATTEIHFGISGIGEQMKLRGTGDLIIGNGGTNFGNATVQSFSAHGATAGESAFSAVDTASVAAGVGGEIAFHGKYNTGAQDYAYLGHIRGIKENATAGNTACALTFHTRPNGVAPQERLRITSDGKVVIGSNAAGAKLSVTGNIITDDGTNARLTLQAESTSTNQIMSTTTGFGSYTALKYQAADHKFLYGGNELVRIHAISKALQVYGGDILLGPDSVSQMEATIRAWGCSLWYTTIDPNYYHDSGGEFRQFYNKGSAAGDNYLTCYNCSIQGSIGPQNRVFWRGAAADTRAEGNVDVSVGYRGAWFFIGQTSCSSIPFQGSGRYLYDSNSPSRVSVSFDSFSNNIDSGELSFHCGSTAGYNSQNSSVGGRLGSSSSDSTLRMYCVGVNMENYNAPNSKRAGNHLGISVMNNDGTDYGSSRLSENLINNSTTGGTNSATGEFNWGNRHSNDRGGTTTFRHSQLMYFDDVQLNSAQWDYLEHYFKVMYG